jgi:heme A synthase
MISPRSFRRLAAVTALFAYLQITLGAIVRVSGSGLGCPDWPLCHGRPYPPADLHSIIEYSHRSVGSVTGLLIIATVAMAWVIYRQRRPRVPVLATGALFAVALEGGVGAFVVFRDLPGLLVLVHLAIALVILGLLISVVVLAAPANSARRDRAFRRLVVAAAAVTYVLLLTGSSVVATDADTVCKAWPLCGAGLQPDFRGLSAYDMLHRISVGVGGLFILHALGSAMRRRRSVPGLGWVAGATAVVFVLQVLAGILVAVTTEVAFFNGLHVALATAVWSGMVAVAALGSLPAGSEERAPSLAFRGGTA